MIDANSQKYNNINEENTNLNIPPSSYTSLYNHYNRNMLEYSNVKNINDIITPNKKIVRSGSVGLIELENKNQSQKKGKYIEYNSNKLTGNKKSSINLYSNITNINPGDYNSIFNLVNKLEPNKIKIIHKSHIIENNSNSQRTKSNNNTNIENRARNILKLNNSKNTFYLPKLNSQKGIINNNNYEYSFANNNNKQNNKSKNTLNVSQFKFKINKGVKKGLNFNNNKLFAFPSNNYKQIFKRSESTGFINLYNNNKSNRAIKNTSTSKKFNGLSNSLANLGIINNSKEKKIKRNASDLFLS